MKKPDSAPFIDFISRISLSTNEMLAISGAAATVFAHILSQSEESSGLVADSCRLMGSVERGTAIHPLNDVDSMVTFSPAFLFEPNSSSDVFLEAAMQYLRERLSDLSAAPIDGALVVETPTGITFEVVPAVRAEYQGYYIPNADTTWTHTDPPAKAAFTAYRDAELAGCLRPTVKLLKRWRSHNRAPINSWHLEAMAGCLFSEPSSDYGKNLLAFFDRGEKVLAIDDPDGVGGPFVDRLPSTLQKEVCNLLRESASIARRALAHGAARDVDGEVSLWRSLLGPEFGT